MTKKERAFGAKWNERDKRKLARLKQNTTCHTGLHDSCFALAPIELIAPLPESTVSFELLFD